MGLRNTVPSDIPRPQKLTPLTCTLCEVDHIGLAVLHLHQRAVREHDMIAVAGIVVSQLPVAFVFEPVRLADDDTPARMAVEPLVDRAGDRARDFTRVRRRRRAV